MFRFTFPAIKKTVITATLALSAFSLNAQATLTNTTSNGVDLVYSSVSDVTWTKDGNLLGTWIASSTDSNGNGIKDIIDEIVAASPAVTTHEYYLGAIRTLAYRITASEFSSDGTTSWWGAMAYVNYLNTINYAGSNQWYLPTSTDLGTLGCDYDYTSGGTDCGYNTATNGTSKGDELAELYYQELGSKGYFSSNGDYQPDHGIQDPNNTFVNEQSLIYWSGTEYVPSLDFAWVFFTSEGLQLIDTKDHVYYAWAVSPGQLMTPSSVVPEPENVVMLLVGLGLLGAASSRRQKV